MVETRVVSVETNLAGFASEEKGGDVNGEVATRTPITKGPCVVWLYCSVGCFGSLVLNSRGVTIGFLYFALPSR